MRKFLIECPLLFLVLAFALFLSTGCAKRAHLNASVERYEYSSSSGQVEVYIPVRNDGERDIGTYKIHYRVTYNSLPHDAWTSGLNLNAGESRTEYAITSIGTGKTVSDVSVTDVKWKVQ
ncbi:MAG TPA: hypothetical protein VMW39_00665 [bacterium]|nr:hypothetical protein [bacterium]